MNIYLMKIKHNKIYKRIEIIFYKDKLNNIKYYKLNKIMIYKINIQDNKCQIHFKMVQSLKVIIKKLIKMMF